MDYGLAGRRALVTGASRGIGRAIAVTLAREGARVALIARSEAGLSATRAAIADAGGDAVSVPADLADPAAAAAVPARTAEALAGAVDVVVLSHGYMTPLGKIHQLDLQQAQNAFDTDLRGSMSLLKAATPDLMGARWGRIVVVGSTLGRMGQPRSPINSAVKAALEGLVKNLALDLGRFGVTANLVAPGFVQGERLDERHAGRSEDFERMKRAASTRAMATPEDVAEVVAFLCSGAARQVSGTVIPVDGALHVGNTL